MDIWTIVSAVLGIVLAIFGGHLATLKQVVKEFEDIPKSIEDALADDKITVDELKNILLQVKEFVKAVKKVF